MSNVNIIIPNYYAVIILTSHPIHISRTPSRKPIQLVVK